jgi:hypothetical protein
MRDADLQVVRSDEKVSKRDTPRLKGPSAG